MPYGKNAKNLNKINGDAYRPSDCAGQHLHGCLGGLLSTWLTISKPSERFALLALKTQGNCRATLETLAKLHQPREQMVRHVHVNEGGRAVVADQFHHNTRGSENGETLKQSHATGAPSLGAALPCPDPFALGMPIDGWREAAMTDARRA